MSATTPRVEPRASGLRTPRPLGAGWRVVAAKEFADHIASARFVVLLIVLGLATFIPLYFAADQIRSAPAAAGDVPAIFLALFWVGSPDISILRVDTFIGIVGPLLGLAFAFDAVNSERSEGTLPRLMSQPIYRDDVINGKFAAGLSVIGLVLIAVVLVISGFGILRLGIVPHGEEVIRLIAWLLATFLYVSLWLAFGLLLSVVIRRAATSALVGFGVWLLLTIFGPLIVAVVKGVFAAPTDATVQQQLDAAGVQVFITRLLPSNLYGEISSVLLQPLAGQSSISAPATVGQLQQEQQQIAGLHSLDQSILLVWPQSVALLALTVLCFIGAYIWFMRQEVRA